jgi:hypothetical protein
MTSPTQNNPILTLYLQHPAAGTASVCLRYQAGQYELLTQHAVQPLISGENITLNEWSIAVQVDTPAPMEIRESAHPTYYELTKPIPVLEQLRKLAPIETDHLTQNHSLDVLQHYFKPQEPEML